MFCCQIGHSVFNKQFFRVSYKTYSQYLLVKELRTIPAQNVPSALKLTSFSFLEMIKSRVVHEPTAGFYLLKFHYDLYWTVISFLCASSLESFL